MDFSDFYEKWLPDHWCPFSACLGIHLYIDPNTNKLVDMVWVDGISNSKNVRMVGHDKEFAPLPDVINIREIRDRKPFVIIHRDART